MLAHVPACLARTVARVGLIRWVGICAGAHRESVASTVRSTPGRARQILATLMETARMQARTTHVRVHGVSPVRTVREASTVTAYHVRTEAHVAKILQEVSAVVSRASLV